MIIVDLLVPLINFNGVVSNSILIKTFDIYYTNNLDFVDCILVSHALEGQDVFTFDKGIIIAINKANK